ncbi:MAG: aldo/keto reductase [Firmicutes bacterium]|nr:aldo/keto reductase [Bacillota bacterium]
MEYRAIPSTGLIVSRMCLGTMMFGGQTEKEAAKDIIKAALDGGVNFFDTANIYNGGASEEIVGEALKDSRSDVIIASKVGAGRPGVPNGNGLGRKHMLKSLEASLKRLGTDYLDIFYCHAPDHITPAEEIIQTMDLLIKQGKIRYWGVSNFAAWEICSIIEKARAMNCAAPVVTQSVYNLLTRGADEELIPFVKSYGIGMVPFNPLAGGLLTGKHSRESAADNTRFTRDKMYFARYWKDQNFDAIDLLKGVADEAGISLIELAVRWLLSEPAITAPILGVSRREQIIQNMQLVEKGPLPADVREKCGAAWAMIKGDYFSYHKD